MSQTETRDLFIIGGGINGAGIARDAAGRGLSVTLAEKDDLAQATSSSSTKLFHGGLRYLEFFEFDLVKKALVEREVLLRNMPHISWPMRFVLPYHPDMRFETETPASKIVSTVMPWMKGRRPSWMIRLGLFMYDYLGGREILPGTRTLNLRHDAAGGPLKDKYRKAYEYSDCWVEDSRLVALNARDAEERGAEVLTRTKVVTADREGESWRIVTEAEGGARREHRARVLINAGGPWVRQIIEKTIRMNSSEGIRLVRGSHIVTKRLFDHERCYFFQGGDGRIIFAIPYERDYTLIGTTDRDHGKDPTVPAEITDAEIDYLLEFASEYFERPVVRDDIVWTYSGVRPLYDDGAKSATAATRDYVLSLDEDAGAPVLHVFGGKITTFRKLAEQALIEIEPHIPDATGRWTSKAPLPGGDFPVNGVETLIAELMRDYDFLDPLWARRLVRAYGTESREIVGNAETADDLGEDFGATLTAAEVRWLMDHEFARSAADVVWRRSKLGLRMSEAQVARLDDWMRTARGAQAAE